MKTKALSSLVSLHRFHDPWRARVSEFRAYTVAHPRLVAAKEDLLAAVCESEANSVILVYGPPGVGKTTLRLRAEQLLSDDLRPELETDRERIPVVGIEAVAPESGYFNWRDYFRRLLCQLNEPLIEHKRVRRMEQNSDGRLIATSKTSGSDYRYAAEQALRHRRPVVVMVDEAQSLAKIISGRRLLDQLDVIKSMANLTGIPHVLFGTYDLLAFRNLNGQLSRRSIDIHFPRYNAESSRDCHAFKSVIQAFEDRLPLPEPPDLLKDWEYLYEKSMGCVGILKQWLTKALCSVLRRGGDAMPRQVLESHALSVSQCARLFADIADGEQQLKDKPTERILLRGRMGLETDTTSARPVTRGARVACLKPGQRAPARDAIRSVDTRNGPSEVV